ncbi:hypothetical protein [Methylobacterium nonmethylotrophicum]|uniref:Uncharacterized protein n=1 Tax=Methylobacterium nonmethylotrophicum TaxID=1141884 RepID=A0A4Z0NMQ1_9HYPH|nr:hypothetical protein [Methylobacterium nonmethylotrophicum]TGD97149.1 hypothetical protein EU555_20515 [Methylobacterium nonmethylotrophicum]
MVRTRAGLLVTAALAAGTGAAARAEEVVPVIGPGGGTTHIHIYAIPHVANGPPPGLNPGPRAPAPPAAGTGGSYWEHEKSVMMLVADGARRRFYYHRPRPGLAEAGARSGSLLFDGVRRGNTYSGRATVFAGACGTFDYLVDGTVVADRHVVMRGTAPRIDRRTCEVVGYRADELAFDLL